MLTIFIASFILFLLFFLALALSYLIKRRRLQGSCGGISALGLEKVCDCPEPCEERKQRQTHASAGQNTRQGKRIL